MSTRRVSIGYATSLLGIFTALLNNVWLLRLVALEVEKTDFGIYLFAISIMAYFGLSQMGLDLASAQRIAEALARGDERSANRIYHQLTWFNRGMCLILTIAVVVAVIVVSVSGFVQTALICWIVGLVGAGMAFKILSNPATAVLSGSQNIHWVGTMTLLNSLCSTLLAYVLLRNGAGILCLPAAQLIITIGILVALHALRRQHCKWSLAPVIELWNGFGNLFRFALGVAAAGALAMIDASSEPIIFQFVSDAPLIDIATFNIWYRFPALSLVIAASLLSNAGPTLAAKMEQSNSEGLRFHRSLLWLASGIGSCATIGLCIWLVPFMHHWLDGTYDIELGRVTAIALATATGFRALMSSLVCVFYPLDRVKIAISGYAVLTVTKIVCGILFVRISPIAGMAWANAGGALVASIYLAYQLNRTTVYSRQTLIGAIAMVLIATAIGGSLAGTTLDVSIQVMAIGICATVFGLGVCYLFLVNHLGIFSLSRFLPSKSY